MIGFLVVAQYAMDDIPLQLHDTKGKALVHIETLQKESPDSLHEIALKSMKVLLGRDATVQIEGAELALTEFDKNGVVCEHEIFGLDTG